MIANKNANIVKMVLIGDNGVGKTNIVLRFAGVDFKEKCKQRFMAEWVEREISIDGKKIRFRLWDTHGGERYMALARLYCDQAHVIILVYDLTNKESFNYIKNFMKEYFPDNIKKDNQKDNPNPKCK